MVAFETTSHKGITSPSDLSKDLKSGAMSQLTAFIKWTFRSPFYFAKQVGLQ